VTDPPPRPGRKPRRRPIGQSIGGVLFGFEQQVWRNVPPPAEVVHQARPDAPIAGADGTMLTIEMPLDDRGGTLGRTEANDMVEPGIRIPDERATVAADPRAGRGPTAPDGEFGRPAPLGFPPERPAPPVIAESGDPFTALRVVDAVARMQRGRPIRLDALVDNLNATHLDWLFPRDVVVSVLVTLQANWMADYRNSSGIVLDESSDGATVAVEDSSRVDPWIVGQARREAAACGEALDEFSRRDRIAGGG
jgi:hypothetical protein